MALIIPVAKSVYLCDGTIGIAGGKTDIVGLFNSMSAPSYPYTATDFVVFAQLGSGLGQVPFHIDIHHPQTYQLVYTSNVHHLHFGNRNMTVQLAYTVPTCTFPQGGLYLIELFCDNQWVADTTLILR